MTLTEEQIEFVERHPGTISATKTGQKLKKKKKSLALVISYRAPRQECSLIKAFSSLHNGVSHAHCFAIQWPPTVSILLRGM
jgi:hypothetical protein